MSNNTDRKQGANNNAGAKASSACIVSVPTERMRLCPKCKNVKIGLEYNLCPECQYVWDAKQLKFIREVANSFLEWDKNHPKMHKQTIVGFKTAGDMILQVLDTKAY